MKFEVPQRQSLASGTRRVFKGAPCPKRLPLTNTPLTLFAPAPSTISRVPPCSLRTLLPFPGSRFVRSEPFHHFLRPANAELVSGGPFPGPFIEGKDRGSQLISEIATERKLLSVIIINPSQPESGKHIRYRRGASGVRN